MSIPYTLGNTFISLVVNGKPFNIASDDARFAIVRDAIKARDWSKVAEAVDTAKAIEVFGAGKVKVYNGVVSYNDKPVNNSVSARILEFVRSGFPFEPLSRFLDKLMLNPSMRSVEQLYNYIELYKLPVMDNGNFLAHKSVRHNMTDHHTGLIDNSVGKVVEVRRNEVSDDSNSACGFGLHVGNVGYVKSFCDGKAIIVEINPMDVVSIPHDASFGKMRVCKYIVLSVVEEKNSELKSFETNYAPQTTYGQTLKPVRDAKGRFVSGKSLLGRDSKGRFVKSA